MVRQSRYRHRTGAERLRNRYRWQQVAEPIKLAKTVGGTGTADKNGGGTEKAKADGDGELDKALKDFDGTILAERGTIASRANEAAGTGDDRTMAPAASAEKGDQRRRRGGSSSERWRPVAERAGTAAGKAAAAADRWRHVRWEMGVPQAPASLRHPCRPEGRGSREHAGRRRRCSDDDVVARQIREAAMDESDPVLKEKLWEEYRRYKAGK